MPINIETISYEQQSSFRCGTMGEINDGDKFQPQNTKYHKNSPVISIEKVQGDAKDITKKINALFQENNT